MAQVTVRTVIGEPLSGEDAERLVSYIENPVMPDGHDAFLEQSKQVYAEVREAPASSDS